MNSYHPVPNYEVYNFNIDDNERRRREMIDKNVVARYPSGKYDVNMKIYNEDDGIANDSRAWNNYGDVITQLPCQAVNNPTIMSFDTTKRDIGSFVSANDVLFTFPEIKNIYSIRLVMVHYPLFTSVTTDQYFNFVLDRLPVMNEAMSNNNANSNTATKVDNVTVQLPLVETTPGSGFCLWKWEQEGQRPQRYTPRESISQIHMKILTKNGAPLDTGVLPPAIGPPVRFILEFVHKK